MKKILAVLMAVLMVASLAACGGNTSAPATEPAPAPAAANTTAPAAETTAPEQSLIDAAKAEGELVVYGSCEEDYLAAACAHFEELYGIKVQYQRLSTGEVQAKIEEENGNPSADAWFGGTTDPYNVVAAEGLLEAYEAENASHLLGSQYRDPDGYWYGIYKGILGFMVNKDELARMNLEAPADWQDLLKPEYKGMVGYLDPTSAAVGQLGVMAINLALGGSYENLDPAIKFFKELQKNQPIVPKQTSYARVISGEIPILLDYDFNAYRGMYKDNAPVAFVIPKEGSVVQPYVMGLAKNAPHAENGKKVLDFVLSDESQTMWGNAFLRPVFADKMSAEAKKKFLPDADYARAKPVDLKKLGAAQNMIVERFKNEVK